MSETFGGVAGQVLQLIQATEPGLAGSPYAPRAAAIRERLEGPLRVAIAGRVKAGKSTLLNALVGERLAPTDAGECTRLVSWYRRGSSYQVSAHLLNGDERNLAFRRGEGALHIELGDLTEREVGSLDIRWPASTLERVTLIDTPGLASLTAENSLRTQSFLEGDGDRGGDADAVVYLMRHVHRADIEFLDAFMDRSITASSPVNAIAVLSRADEIGAGRLDAMESANRIAERYAEHGDVRQLVAKVVPLAGLLAETGLTLREDEFGSLRLLAGTDDEQLQGMLLSVEQFLDVHASDLTVEIRHELLDRLGMFGVRLAVQDIRSGAASTGPALANRLVEHSGLPVLRSLIEEHFLPRARSLQARSALVALRSLARELRNADSSLAAKLDREAERIEASAVEFTRIRAAHLVSSGAVRVADRERQELERLLLAPSAPLALGLSGGDDGSLRAGVLQAIERWRIRAADPLAEPAMREVCDSAVRTCELFYAELAHAG